ncbi:MAG: bifunctional 4-hydroxy-2-oxoglutarate aldolase/2-dehydro-3-deoxy-phosphogluconate aldolase [Opitutales bacterium]|nr:bifunctional 4-hydroxy-2-oxoglutarate aldolase/2-dehydro-3-deoxy-phosphogluconate aldolase [Opitutales bacterium]
MEAVIDHRSARKIIPISIFDDPNKAVPLAHALLAGGCDVVEISFRSSSAAASIAEIVADVPEMFVGAGSLLSVDDVSEAISAGASFGIAPGFDPSVVKAAAEAGFPFVPGFFTPSNVTQALSFGCEVQKFFPAESVGPAFLTASLAAFNHKHNLKVIAAGGINPENVARWLVVPQVVACGASWVCPKDMIEAEDWAGITARAQQLCAVAHSVVPAGTVA